MSSSINIQDYAIQGFVDSRIKANRDDVLHIVQADIKRLEGKVDSNFEVLKTDIIGSQSYRISPGM